MKKRKILITGGAGFVGYHLAHHLLEETDAHLVLVDNLQRGKINAEMKALLDTGRVELLQLDLTNPSVYSKLGSGYDHVYHLAAVNGTKYFYQQPHEVLRCNTLSLIYMLEWFKDKNKNGKFCFTSSNEAYASALSAFGSLPLPTPENVPLVIEDPYNPRWSYGATKLIGELLVIHYATSFGFRALIVRPHNFYGPRAGYDHVIPEVILRVKDKIDPFPLYGGNQTRTFCYITDAVRAMALLMDSKKTDNTPPETVHIGDYYEITIEQLAKKIFALMKHHPSKIEEHNPFAGSVNRRLPDVTKLRTLVDWKPRVSLDEGLERTLDWYLKNPKKA